MKPAASDPAPIPEGTIGYLVPEFPGQTHAFFWREVKAMEDAGARVVLFSTSRPAAGACPHGFAADARSRTAYVYPPRALPALRVLAGRPLRAARAIGYILGLRETPFPRRLRLLGLVGCAADLFDHARDKQVLHLHIHSCADAAHLGALLTILRGPSYSLTLHGDLPVYGTDHAAKMRHACFVSAVTRQLKEQIHGVLPGIKVPVIRMGVDIDEFRPAPRGETAPVEILSVSRLNPTKGHVHYLRALARLSVADVTFRYRIAGSGPAEQRISDSIVELGLAERVEMLGSVSQHDVLALLRDSDIFVLSSFGKGEAAPVAVMEAMACGLAVICSRIGGTEDMIDDGVDGILIAQQDEDALAEATGSLIAHPELRKRLGESARVRARSEFDYRINAAKLLDEILACMVGSRTESAEGRTM